MANDYWIDLRRVETTLDRVCGDLRILSCVLRDCYSDVDDLAVVLMTSEADEAMMAMERVKGLYRMVQRRAESEAAKGGGDGQ